MKKLKPYKFLRAFILIALVSPLMLLIPILPIPLVFWHFRAPSKACLLHNFERNREKFEKIKNILLRSNVEFLVRDRIYTKERYFSRINRSGRIYWYEASGSRLPYSQISKITLLRSEEYEACIALLSSLGSEAVIRRVDSRGTRIVFDMGGGSAISHAKNIVYQTYQPAQHLEAVVLEPNWYFVID